MIGERLGIRPRVAVRVNPDFQVKGSGMRMGGGPAAVRRRRRAGAGPAGASSRRPTSSSSASTSSPARRTSNAEILCEAQRKTVELALRLADAGARRRSATSTSAAASASRTSRRTSRSTSAAIGENLARLLADAIRPSLPEARVVIELGRYIVGECGRLRDPRRRPQGVARQDLSRRRRRHAPPARRLRQLRPGDPPQLPGRDRQPRERRAPTETVSVVGCLCTPLDLLADDVALPAADVGDLVVVFQAGAYGLTASPTAFLSHPAPVEVLV